MMILPHPQLDVETAQTAHFIIEWLAIFVGVQLYRSIRANKLQPLTQDARHFSVVIGCIAGAAIGNKLVFLAEASHTWVTHGWRALLMGQSIVGGLVGGLIGVEATKTLTGVKTSTGDDFVLPIMIGTAVGRIGCYLAGLHDGTYGLPTHMSWGVDLGDGVLRHPAPLYELIFVLIWGAFVIHIKKKRPCVDGLSFKLYLSGYLLWRLMIEFIKPRNHLYAESLSGIQLVCLISLFFYAPFVIRDCFKQPK